jgi:hypothetical protein
MNMADGKTHKFLAASEPLRLQWMGDIESVEAFIRLAGESAPAAVAGGDFGAGEDAADDDDEPAAGNYGPTIRKGGKQISDDLYDSVDRDNQC